MKDTKIEWCDHTFNPWLGCSKVSPGCERCYAQTLVEKRFKKANWGKGNPRVRTSEAYWKQPLKWNETWICELCGAATKDKLDPKCSNCGVSHSAWRSPRVFCASLADWLDDEVPIEWLADLLKLIHDTPNLDWLLLTKRPENWAERIRECCNQPQCYRIAQSWLSTSEINDGTPKNVRLGVSVENQEQADKRIPLLLQIPAKVRFLSMEPLLGPVDIFNQTTGDLEYYSGNPYNPGSIDWVIVGGESGSKKRKFELSWAYDLRDQCKNAHDGVPFFMKQIDKVQPIPDDLLIREFPKSL